MQKIINAKLNEQELTLRNCTKTALYTESLNYLVLNFNFDELWQNLDKYIIFKNTKGNYQYPIDSEIFGVPNFLLEKEEFRMTLVGYDVEEDPVTRVTTNEVKVILRESGFTDDIDSYEDDVEDVYQIILQKFEDYYTKTETQELLIEKTSVSDVELEIKRAYRLLENDIRTYGGN